MAMFSQNPIMNGPNYSFSDTPTTANGGHKEHRFNPYVATSEPNHTVAALTIH
ncbi:hypothetical protein IMZ48_19045 [Candidatus Bathyarchaeota archaeon]|nr:hypothetical protein [Candidatus Bathyarchaeota archaeon]